MMLLSKCENCTHWVWINAGPTGQCHRMPPVPHPQKQVAVWPITTKQDFCGEFLVLQNSEE